MSVFSQSVQKLWRWQFVKQKCTCCGISQYTRSDVTVPCAFLSEHLCGNLAAMLVEWGGGLMAMSLGLWSGSLPSQMSSWIRPTTSQKAQQLSCAAPVTPAQSTDQDCTRPHWPVSILSNMHVLQIYLFNHYICPLTININSKLELHVVDQR